LASTFLETRTWKTKAEDNEKLWKEPKDFQKKEIKPESSAPQQRMQKTEYALFFL
jgi:hypothetical protein